MEGRVAHLTALNGMNEAAMRTWRAENMVSGLFRIGAEMR